MDMATMIEERLLQCCVHVATVAIGRPPVRAVLRRAGVAGSFGATPPAGDPCRMSPTTRCGCASTPRSPSWPGFSGRSRWSASRCWASRLPARPAPGLTRSKCVLRDTRLVLAYLGVLARPAWWAWAGRSTVGCRE
jgi:hypothetical protein